MTNYVAALVDELHRLGVREVVISPGSRSTPLAMLFVEHHFEVYVNIDERSAGFFALGIAKEKARPVVLVCTSGSAAGHYYPALIEAKYSRVPLIVLTADRPHELRHVGAPQAIDQNNMFGGYADFYEELALPEDNEGMYRYVRAVMRRAFAAATAQGFGVAHINIPLREPLIPDFNKLDFAAGRSGERFKIVEMEGSGFFDASVFQDRYGIMIAGGDAYADYHADVLDLGDRLKSPILADPISNFRNYASHLIIDSYDAFLKNEFIVNDLKPEYIIHFGQVPVSKRLQQFLARHRDVPYYQVDRVFQYRNPALSTHTCILSPPGMLAKAVTVQNSDRAYLNKWQDYQKQMRKHMKAAWHEEALFEGKIVQKLQEILPVDCRLVVANSMPIREIDYFFEARNQKIKVLGNRGANGIDGIVSTALGISTANKPTILLTGDLAFFHDFNGLLIGKTHNLNLVIVLLNNNGGGIFKYLPQSEERYFETLFLTPHKLDFEGLKTLYGVAYSYAESYEDFEHQLKEALTLGGIQVIELKINLNVSKKLHDRYTILPDGDV